MLFLIEPTATLETAVHKLAKHRIGALLVLGPDNRVVGILSERDVVRVMAERGAGVLSEPLSQVMTRKVVTCGQTDHRRLPDGTDDDGQVPPHPGGRAGARTRRGVDRR
jgi:signal-transduction protein with cAMP-binding, CBS, and nucleotidyltransferase domain